MSTGSASSVTPLRRQMTADLGASLNKLVLSLYDQTVELRYPESLESDIKFLFRDSALNPTSPQTCITIKEDEAGRFSIQTEAVFIAKDLSRVELPIWLIE